MKPVIISLLWLALLLPLMAQQPPAASAAEEDAFVVPDRAETPSDVLLIMAMARTLEEVEVILPEYARREAKRLYKDDREALLDELALGMLGRRMGYTVKPGEETGLIAYAERDGKRELELRVFHQVIGGDEAVILFGVCHRDKLDECLNDRAQAWVKHEDYGWRLMHIVEAKAELSLDEPEYFQALRDGALGRREERALQTIMAIKAALASYAAKFPERAAPLEIQAVIEAEQKKAEKPGISIERELRCRRNVCVGGGYRYAYEPVGSGYMLSARPARYRVTGELSFMTTDSRDLHCTPDERVPSERDPVAKGSITSCRETPRDEPPPQPE